MDPATLEIRTAAQRWFARLLADDCSDAERTAFECWRAANPARAAAFHEVEEIWRRSEKLRADPAIAIAVQEALRPSGIRSRFPRWWLPALAAAASLLLGMALLYRMSWVPEGARYATGIGEVSSVTLDDGSTVVLDTATDLQVQFGKRERRLTLQQGRADFQVRHDTDRPFIVHAAGGSVTATGTQFQVRVEGGIGTVTLLAGQVMVAAQARDGGGRQSATLAAGERIAIESSGKLGPLQRVSETELASVRGWTEGKLVVKEWPLEAVLAEMNRYSDTKLRLGDPDLREVRISGVFKAGDPRSFAMSLEYGWPIRADIRSGEIVLFRK